MVGNEDRDLIEYYGGPIAPYLADPAVTEIMVNTYRDVWIERAGRLIRTDTVWPREEDLIQFIRMIANRLDQERSLQERGNVDARLEDGTRVNATLAPTAVLGACMSFRPYPKTVFTKDDLLRRGALTPEIVELIERAIRGRLNILISGGTGSGKTTILRCACQSIPHEERVLTIEGTCENLLPDHPHKLYFEAPKRKTAGPAGAMTVGNLIENSLRQRPDRIVVGEIRTPEEAAALIDAMNTGHEGTLGTIHANSAYDSLSRVEVLYARQASNFSMDIVRDLVRSNLDLVIYISRDVVSGRATRRVKEILWLDERKPIHLMRHRRVTGYEFDHPALDSFRKHLSI
jgi:pilus assembly protein CpaF